MEGKNIEMYPYYKLGQGMEGKNIEMYPYYKLEDKGWKVIIECTLVTS